MNDAENNAWKAVGEYVKPRMGVVIADEGENQFSCTFARFRGRHLAITAAHCLHDIKSVETIRISTFARQSPTTPVTPKAIHSPPKLPGDLIPAQDVGAIELLPNEAATLGVDWFETKGMTSRYTKPGAPVCLPGFPWELFEPESTDKGTVMHPTPTVYGTAVADRVPDSTLLKTPSDWRNDFYLEYNPKMELHRETGSKTAVLHPRGMSGGGVFVIPLAVDGEVWSPSIAMLAGVQSSYVGAAKLLRCKRIEHLFPLLDSSIVLREAAATDGDQPFDIGQ